MFSIILKQLECDFTHGEGGKKQDVSMLLVQPEDRHNHPPKSKGPSIGKQVSVLAGHVADLVAVWTRFLMGICLHCLHFLLDLTPCPSTVTLTWYLKEA